MSVNSSDLFNKLYTKFDLDARDIFTRETMTGRLTESGQPRVALRNIVLPLVKTADNQLDPQSQVKLCTCFAVDFFTVREYDLALECFQFALNRCDSIKDESNATKNRVEAMQNIVSSSVAILDEAKYCRISPMSVSKLLVCLQDLRKALDEVFLLSGKSQEELAWAILNSCKLIMEVGQPLIWYSCGKYVAETIVFAATAMEAVINLCTVRHLKFRMKMYAAVFYGVLTMGSLDEADGIYEHALRQAKELRAREEIDPPIPEASLRTMEESDMDLAVMKLVLDFWRDPDSVGFTAAHLEKYYVPKIAVEHKQSFADRCISECIRVHLLASGNTNEPFRKRTSCILKGVVKLLEPYKVEARDADAPVSPRNQGLVELFSTQVLLEVAILALFEVYEGVTTEELLAKVFAVAKDVVSFQQIQESEEPVVQLSDDVSQKNLLLLQQITQLVALESLSTQRAVMCADVVVALETLLYSDISYRKKAFIRKVCIFLWTKFIYSSAQTALSSFDSTQSLALIEEITPAVSVSVKALDAVLWEDVVLVGSMAQLAGNLLWITGDHRGAISLLRQAIENLDQHRAARVDLSLHMPEDVRDVFALQRASVTTRSEEQDWFHSTKRLGAHAFAGYGIFGLSSSADRSDQAVAELQTELTSLYFRYELEHAIASRHKRLVIKEATCKLELVKEKAEVRNNKAKVKIAAPTIDKKAVTKSLMMTQTMLSSEETDCEKLSVVPSLRSFCVKNSYYSCLLLMEMSRLDTSEERRFEYLKQALALIEESEGREEMLKESFKNLIVMTHAHRSYPLLLARSHRYMYVVPVGMRKQKAAYYRVFAKEKGSGTDVSIYNDDLAGCEKRISVMSLKSLKGTVVRVGPLRRGELYMLGCVAFTAEDKPVGGVSPTSPIIEAVNPLPTVLLWSLLNQTAGEVLSQSTRLSREASLRVCNRYFLPTPSVSPLVVGKGVNLFLYTEPALCTLAVQQSTPLLLYNFIRSFIAYEKLTAAKRTLDSDSANWVLRKPTQVSYMNSLQRTALVTALSVAVGNHDLTLQCVKLGYSQAIDMIRYDVIHLAFNLQNPLTVLVLGMQNIAKRNWRILEHKLYTKLVSHLVKVATLNRNVTPVISVLNQLYPESVDKELVSTSLPAKELLVNYLAVLSVVKDHLSLTHLGPMMQQINALHVALTHDAFAGGEKSDVGYLWKMSETQRTLKLQGTAVDFAQPAEKPTPEKEQLDNWMINEKPEQMSDLLQVIHLLGREVLAQEKPTLWHKILSRLPVYAEYLSPELQAAHSKWGLQLLLPVSNLKDKPLSPRAAAAAAKKAPPAKGKGAVEVPEVPPEDPCKVPERFLTCTPEETQRQWFYLAQILFTSASACCDPDAVKINAFPASVLGPNIPVDPASATTVSTDGENAELATGLAAVPPVDRPASAPAHSGVHGHLLSRAEYVKYLGAAVELFSKAHSASSAVLAAVKLWNFIGCDWIDPSQFSKEFEGSAETLHHTSWALVSLLESLTYCGIEVVDVGELSTDKPLETAAVGGTVLEGSTVAWNTQSLSNSVGSVGNAGIGLEGKSATGLTVREVKESMLLVKDLIIFLLKVKWLHRDYAEVVKIGVRVFLLLSTNCPEYCKSFGDHCMPLIVHAQEMLVSNAKDFLNARQKDLDDFIFNYEEAQKKKRKKKLRIAKTEKDEEELIFDAECAVFQSKIDEARAKFEKCEKDLETVRSQQTRFDTLYSAGSQLFDKVKRATAKFLNDLRAEFGHDVDFRSLNNNETVQTNLAAILKQFRPVVSFLREKKDKLVLIEALKEQADLLLAFGRLADVRNSLHDLIDGLFNTIDSCANWTTVAGSAVESLEPELVPGIIPAIVALGKLSRYCVPTDLDAKSNYCRMAAELCRIPFFESYGHPQTTVGFAAYVCQDLGGVHGLTLNSEALSSQGLSVALEEVLSVLLAERYFVACLPVVALLEHFYAYFLKNPSFWLKARLIRIKALIGGHHFAEAASMIASIKSSIKGIYQQNFSDPLRIQTSAETATLANFETSLNGLNFHGVVPFLNNCLPDEEKNNAKALEWIKAFPADFEIFAKAYQLKLPPPVLTEEQKAALAAQKAEAEAAELAKKAKAKGGKPAAAPVEEAPVHENCVPIFNEVQLSDVYTTCGMFLLELAMLDGQSTAKHSASLQKLGTSATELLTKSITTLYACATMDNIRSSAWVDLNGTCQLLLCKYKLHRRKLKESRAALLKYVDFMKSPVFSSLNGDSRYIMSQQWFAAHDMLTTISTRQARHGDGIAMASKSATEASMLYCGYWLRAFLVQRAAMEFTLGNVHKSLADVDAALGLFQSNHVEDLLFVRCLSLKASVIREKAMYASKQTTSAAAFVECIVILRQAKEVSERLAHQNGAFPSDANVVYSRSDTAVLTHHKIAPILNNFTTRHNNEPELTLKVTLEKKRLEQMGIKLPQFAEGSDATGVAPASTDELRLGPVDFTETVFTLSEYANIYLPEVRALVNASSALCVVLDDFRLSGAVEGIKTPPADVDLSTLQSNAVLKEEEYLSESALKLMRQSVYTSPTSRVTLLSIVGKVRVALAATQAAENAGLLITDDLFLPFKAALDIAVKSVHPWELIRSLCLQMVEAYGDGALDFGDENSNRMKYAVTYMIGAVKAGIQYSTLTKNATGISDDPTFTATPPSEELMSLMVNTTSSSATLPKVEAAEVPAAAAAGKGAPPAKPAKGAPAASPAGAGPNGRDALFLLSSVLRETDPLWKDTHDHDISGDLHNLLKKTYALYGQKCSLDKAPDVKDPAVVAAGGTSTLWFPTKTPADFATTLAKANNTLDYSKTGLYSHVAVFFLLGDRKSTAASPAPAPGGKAPPAGAPAAGPANSVNPVLTRLVLSRVDVVYIEKRLRDVRDRYIDAETKKFPKTFLKCNQELGEILCLLVGLLKTGLIIIRKEEDENAALYDVNGEAQAPKSKCTYTLSDAPSATGSYTLTLSLATNGKVTSTVVLPVTESLILNLATLFSTDRDTDSLLDGDALALIRSALGYVEK